MSTWETETELWQRYDYLRSRNLNYLGEAAFQRHSKALRECWDEIEARRTRPTPSKEER